jgi:hypothetical protein
MMFQLNLNIILINKRERIFAINVEKTNNFAIRAPKQSNNSRFIYKML